MQSPQCKICPLDQTELAKLKKQIMEALKKTRFGYLIVLMGPLSFLPRTRIDNYIYALTIIM